jgi:hypothetical protein
MGQTDTSGLGSNHISTQTNKPQHWLQGGDIVKSPANERRGKQKTSQNKTVLSLKTRVIFD